MIESLISLSLIMHPTFIPQGIPQSSASFLLSIIGITNTFGRVFCGYIADFPKVDSLLLNNICLLISTVAVATIPFCSTYEHYVIMSIFFGLAICKSYFIFSCSFHSIGCNFIISFSSCSECELKQNKY